MEKIIGAIRVIYHSLMWQKPSKMVKFNLVGLVVLVTTTDLDVRYGWYLGNYKWMTYNMKKWQLEEKNVIAWRLPPNPYKTKEIKEIVRKVKGE